MTRKAQPVANLPSPADPSDPAASNGSEPGRKIVLTPASAIPVRPVHWLWQDRLPEGALAILGGREGIGKSILAYQLVADVTTGSLPGRSYRQPRPALIAATEDSWSHVIAPRLIAAGADLDWALRVEVVNVAGFHDQLVLPIDVDALRVQVLELAPALLVLDPLIGRVAAKLDTHVDQEVRQALEPLAYLADESGMTVLGLVHVNKSASLDPLTLIMASRAFVAVPRAVLFVARDPANPTIRVLGQPKNSLGRQDLPHLAFTVTEEHVADTDEGPVLTGKLRWQGETDRTIEAVLRDGVSSNGSDDSVISEAAAWLTDYLQIHKVAESQEVKRAGKEMGHGTDALRRAREKIKAPVASFSFPRRTAWCEKGLDPDELYERLRQLSEPQSGQVEASQMALPVTGEPAPTGTASRGSRARRTGEPSSRGNSPRRRKGQSARRDLPPLDEKRQQKPTDAKEEP
jgi:hypothetical protein